MIKTLILIAALALAPLAFAQKSTSNDELAAQATLHGGGALDGQVISCST